MINYSNFCRDVKTDLMNFLNQALFGKIKSLPDKKLILDLTFGVLKSGSLHLSNIVRALKEDSKPINVEKRLSDALKSRDLLKYENFLMQYNLRELCIEPIKIITDDSDIIKPYGRKFEYLTYVRDGSKPGHPKEKGYNVTCCSSIGSKNTVVPLSIRIYSTIDKNYVSHNNTTFKILDNISFQTNKKMTYILDRGYDSSDIINHLSKKGIDYIIRAKNQRKYGKYTISELFSKMKGLYANNYINKEKKTVHVKFNAKRFSHPSINNPFFFLVYEKNNIEKDYRVYITNKLCNTKNQIEEIIKGYRLRWRIEELFRFIKGEYGFEKYRVRSIKAMNNLGFIILIVVSYLTYIYSCNNHIYQKCLTCYMNFKNEKREKEIETEYGYYGIKLYRLKGGIKDILTHLNHKPVINKNKTKIQHYEQLTLF